MVRREIVTRRYHQTSSAQTLKVRVKDRVRDRAGDSDKL